MRIVLLASVLILGCALGGCEGRGEPEPADQGVRPARILIVTASDEAMHHQFVARVEAAQSIDVSFEVSGPLAELPVLEGQTVTRGDLVAALDPTEFRLAVREAEVQVRLARQDLERKQRMLAQKSIAQSIVDDAQSMHELQVVRLERARKSLADSRVHAPFDAYVARRYVDRFVKVQVGDPVVLLNDLHRLLVVASIPESLLATVTTEQVLGVEAEFSFAPGQRFPLTVIENRGDADPVTQTYEVSFAMARPAEWNLLPGMSATVHARLRGTGAGAVPYLPSSALVSTPGRELFVWLYDPATQAVTQRFVTVGVPSAPGIPVLEGLADGDMVVATGASQLREGMRVHALGAPARTL